MSTSTLLVKNNVDSKNNLYKIHDKLYDLCEFIKIHPGGQEMFSYFQSYTNITPMLYSYHKNPLHLLTILEKYQVESTLDSTLSDNLIKYNTNYNYDLYVELKRLVYREIYEKRIPLYWSSKEIAYNAILFSLYVIQWIHLLMNSSRTTLSHWWIVLLSFYSVGFIALLFHETSHYCGFKNQTINRMISNYIAFPFLLPSEWKERHNYVHHSFTNTPYDPDFDKSKFVLRHSSNHPHHTHHKFQWLYASILFFLNGYNRTIITYIKNKKYTYLSVVLFIFYQLGISNALLLFGSIGFGFTFIANLSHIQYECIEINKERKNDFLYNQVASSMNYKTNDMITRFICFGLDIQIEHHLFPNLPHSSLRQIKHVVREYCHKNDIPYIEKPTMFSSIYSYLIYLYNIGNRWFTKG